MNAKRKAGLGNQTDPLGGPECYENDRPHVEESEMGPEAQDFLKNLRSKLFDDKPADKPKG